MEATGYRVALALLVGAIPATTTSAQVPVTAYLYTTDADFDMGTLVSVNHLHHSTTYYSSTHQRNHSRSSTAPPRGAAP